MKTNNIQHGQTYVSNVPSYDKFLWLELIGFDNLQEDMGAKAYIDNLGFIPQGISIFMWGPDFVHLHKGLDEDENFPPDIGAYLDYAYHDKKQPGPAWTKHQLRLLIRELQNYGVKIYFSVFPHSLGNRFHKEWVSDNLEVAVNPIKDWEPWFPTIHPLKRLRDGSYYEDFFVEKLTEVTRDYNFDGFHMVDGYNHGWYQLCHAEYSDDMVEQFLDYSSCSLPSDIAIKCDSDINLVTKKSEWIWTNQRREWIDFHVKRWETFYTKVVNAMHNDDREVACNTCWTRDPFEAIYRYGIDYKKIAATGVDRFIIETCGAGGEILDGVCRARFSVPFYHVIMATSLLTRAYIPDAKIKFNNCIQDITEGWSILHHAPAFLEKEIYSYSNLYTYDSAGVPRKCFDGLQVCLAADVEQNEWKWLKEKWDLGFSTIPESVSGLTLVWSDQAFEKELDYYLDTRSSLTHNLLYQLTAKGVPVYSSVNIDNLEKVSNPLLIINPHLFPEKELARILEYSAAPVIMIGPECPEPDFGFEDVYAPNQLFFGLYGMKKEDDIIIEEDEKEDIPQDFFLIKEPPSFFDEQYFRKVSKSFLSNCAKIACAVVDDKLKPADEKSKDAPFFRIETLKKHDGSFRFLVGNDSFQYIESILKADSNILEIETVTPPKGRPIITFNERKDAINPQNVNSPSFAVRIPPKGIRIIDAKLE